MLEVVIILMEVIKNFVEMVINSGNSEHRWLYRRRGGSGDCGLHLINIHKRESQLGGKEYQHHGQQEQHVGRKGLCDGPEN